MTLRFRHVTSPSGTAEGRVTYKVAAATAERLENRIEQKEHA